ncbi:hypothetical protein AFCA_011442 [Aspergillus flavus]|nr:hypothetical protein AFCA_011442 [Aspergillus flavus]
MASTMHNTQGSVPGDAVDTHFQIRDYQVEMVNKSLEGNLIVVHVRTITAHVPPMWCRSFTSNDNVDHWGTVETWNIALASVKVAISTYQVLYDALVHRFVTMDRLSLIIFDEGKF